MQLATILYDVNKKIPVPCKWGDYTVLAVRDTYLNGYKAKLLTLGKWQIDNIPDFPLPEKHFNKEGRYILPRI